MVRFSLTLPVTDAVTIEVFDVLGRRVLEQDLGVQLAGAGRHTINLGNAPAGVYFVRATASSGQSATRRIVHIE
jgi:hypothetical protein